MVTLKQLKVARSMARQYGDSKNICCRHLFAMTEAISNARIAMKEIEE